MSVRGEREAQPCLLMMSSISTESHCAKLLLLCFFPGMKYEALALAPLGTRRLLGCLDRLAARKEVQLVCGGSFLPMNPPNAVSGESSVFPPSSGLPCIAQSQLLPPLCEG